MAPTLSNLETSIVGPEISAFRKGMVKVPYLTLEELVTIGQDITCTVVFTEQA